MAIGCRIRVTRANACAMFGLRKEQVLGCELGTRRLVHQVIAKCGNYQTQGDEPWLAVDDWNRCRTEGGPSAGAEDDRANEMRVRSLRVGGNGLVETHDVAP